MTPALCCMEIGSVAIGYRCLAEIVDRPDVEVLDASVVGGARYLILLRGPAAAVTELAHAAQKLVIAQGDGQAPGWESFVASPEPIGFVDAYFSLAEQRMDESLIVCETPSLSALLSASAAILGQGQMRPLDMKALRGAQGGAIGFFSGPDGACGLAAEGARSRLRGSSSTARVETIEKPGPKFRAYFNPDGVA